MCVDVHKGIAKMLGLSEERIEEVLQGVDAIQTGEKEKALLNFFIHASKKDNCNILKSDIYALKAMGYSDVEILETVAITGYFNYINTLLNIFAFGE